MATIYLLNGIRASSHRAAGDFQPFLIAIVAVTQRHVSSSAGFFAQRVEVDRHAERLPAFVLARVAFADGTVSS